jgi:hypothetical protein
MLGIGSLIGWNAILSTLDFLDQQYPGYHAIFTFPIPFFLTTNLISILIFKISSFLSMSSRIIMG